MNPKTYQELAERTSATATDGNRPEITSRLGSMAIRMADVKTMRLLHGAIGLCTEVGELQDQLKRHIFYGTELDLVNIAEEVGDIMWYIAETLNAIDGDLLDVMAKNIEKLRKRFPDKFTESEAVNRNLAAERETLEGGE